MDVSKHLAPGAELIAVSLAGQLYAIDIMQVREIRGWSTSTPLPHAPDHVLGMISLRGMILPIVDLASRLGLGEATPGASSVVMVVQIDERPFGLLVDAVCDIIQVTDGLVQPPPDVGRDVRDFLAGVMSLEQGIVSLLCLDSLLPATSEAYELAA